MTMPNEEELQEVTIPAAVPPPEPVVVEEEPEPESDIDDLFEVPQPEDNDMRTDHLFAAPEEDDLSDLTDTEGIMELDDEPEPVAEPPQRTTRKVRVVRRRPPTPPPSLGGVNY